MIVTVMYGVVRDGMTSRSGIIWTFYVLECADEIRSCFGAGPRRRRRAAGRAAREHGVALLRRRFTEPSLLAARADYSRQLQHARDRVAVQDREPGPASGVQARRHAAHGE